MYDILKGVRVVEVAEMLMGPSCGMALADWGADVIKVERTGSGDRIRNMAILTSVASWNVHLEIANRGKRSVALELTDPEGQEILRELIKGADVFITNIRLNAQRKMGITAEQVTAVNPNIVYAWLDGHGPKGPLAELPGFDWPSSWCRSGTAFAQTPPGGEPPNQPASVGDLLGGLTTAGAIAAALYKRERTGKGSVINNSLYHTGIFIMTQAVTLGAAIGARPADNPLTPRRDTPYSATVYAYRTRDDRWIALCMLIDTWWPGLTKHLEREDLLTDPRFVTETLRLEHRDELIAELQSAFSKRTFEDWKTVLASYDGVWAPLASPDEVANEEHALVNGYVTPVTMKDGSQFMSVATPCQFDEEPIGELHAAPDFGEHTDQVLTEIGISPERISYLRKAGKIN